MWGRASTGRWDEEWGAERPRWRRVSVKETPLPPGPPEWSAGRGLEASGKILGSWVSG